VSDVPAAAPAPEQPPQAEPKLYAYRITTLNGIIIDITSPNEMVTLWSIIVRDGWVVTPEDFIPYHALASIKALPPPKAEGPKVVPFLNRG
jgi:hypothetical protein